MINGIFDFFKFLIVKFLFNEDILFLGHGHSSKSQLNMQMRGKFLLRLSFVSSPFSIYYLNILFCHLVLKDLTKKENEI